MLTGYDESAVEQALLLKDAVPGSQVRAISFGPAPRTEEVLRAALALGCDAATWCEQPAGGPADPTLAARILALACRRYPYDLILTGKQASDDEAGLFGPALGELLGIADYGSVVDLRWDATTERFQFGRAVEGGVERVETPAPCVVALQQAWNDPRTAKLQNVLKSRRIPIEKIAWTEGQSAAADVAPGVRPLAFRLPPPRAGARMIEFKTPAEAAQKLVQLLREEARTFP